MQAYAGKKDKAGETYILHPLRVMAKVSSTREKAVALLHDVIEDSDFSADDLLAEGIPADIVAAVTALTRRPAEDYEQFIERVQRDRLAVTVKLADIEDNLNVLRLAELNAVDLKRTAKYHRAWQQLNKHR